MKRLWNDRGVQVSIGGFSGAQCHYFSTL
jgi:hypothetical protein